MRAISTQSTASAAPSRGILKAILRIVVCLAAVLAVVALLYVLPLENRRLVPAALILLLVVLIVSAAWGFRYALFVSFLAALGFGWLAPPEAHFSITDARDVFALAAFLAVGIIGSHLSDRARKEALNANQRRAEAVAAQERFADLVNSVEGIVWEADAETFAFSFVSDQAERILGYSTGQWLREPTFWKDHLHPDDRDWTVEFCKQAAAEKRSHDFEYRMIAADGHVVWMRDLVSVVVENGRATRLRGVMVDVTRRKADERAVQEQAGLLSLTHDAIFVRDMQSVIKYWNRGAEELYGWTAEQALGKLSHELLKTVLPVPLNEIDRELMHSGRWEGELVHTKKFGTPVIVASRWSLQRDERGTPIAVLETNNDITDRKRAEQAREEIEEQWRAAFESNPTMYFIVDSAGTIVSVNTFGAEQLGYSIEELVGTPVLNVFHEPDREAVQNRAQECFEHLGRTMRWEARKIRKNGTMLWVRETANAVFLKNRPVLLVVCEDITEQKRAEEAARRSERELRDVIETIPAMVWAAAPNGSNAFVNKRWEEYTGLSAEQTAGSGWLPVLHPEDVQGYVDTWRDSVAKGKPFEHEARFRRAADGQYCWFWSRGVPLRDDRGHIVKWFGIVTDITERKRAEEERERLRELEADLAHINRVSMMGELAASLGHEVKQPIAAAITNANTCLRWLKREEPDLDEAREAASRMVEDAMRAVEIINRTSSLYKKGAPQRELVNMNEVISEIVELLRNEAARYDVSIRSELATDVPKVTGDRVQLQQVLMNLIINSIDAMKRVDGPREITITSQRDGKGQLLVSVSDTGVGLPQQTDQIFNAFFTTKPHGTGMGLAISRTIIESHGGRLSASPNTGRGATFHFTLPIAAEAAA